MPSLGAVRRSGSMETLRQSPSLCRAADVLYLLGRGAQLEHLHMINVQYASHQPGPTFKGIQPTPIFYKNHLVTFFNLFSIFFASRLDFFSQLDYISLQRHEFMFGVVFYKISLYLFLSRARAHAHSHTRTYIYA